MRAPTHGGVKQPNHVERMMRRVQNFLQIGKSTTTPIDTGNVQSVQIKPASATTRDAVPVLFHYGFSSSMPVGSDVVVLNVSGDGSNGLVIASGNQTYRIKGLTNGQVALYDSTGSTVLLDNEGGISLTPSKGIVTINGEAVISGDAKIGGISFLRHVHGDVQTGSGSTTAPEAMP